MRGPIITDLGAMPQSYNEMTCEEFEELLNKIANLKVMTISPHAEAAVSQSRIKCLLNRWKWKNASASSIPRTIIKLITCYWVCHSWNSNILILWGNKHWFKYWQVKGKSVCVWLGKVNQFCLKKKSGLKNCDLIKI